MTRVGFAVVCLYFSFFALALAGSRRDTDRLTKELPVSSTSADGESHGSGELCDPSKPKTCENPSAECMWSSQDMLYKCISRKWDENKRNITRKRQAKHRKPANYTPAKFLVQGFGDGASEQNGNEQVEQPVKSTIHEIKPRLVVTTYANPAKRATQNIGRTNLQTNGSGSAISRVRKKLAELARAASQQNEGTFDIPKYSGTMTWDGKSDYSDECQPKSTMAEELQEKKLLENKERYIESNRDKICDFTKFFHCTTEKNDKELSFNADKDTESTDNTPVCRCYESAMTVVRGVCYIPADFGTKSSCGDHVTAPYPVKPWKGAPVLRPKCTPNSDCVESQYWFGKRCHCRYNVKWNSATRTCDNGTKNAVSFALLMLSTCIIPFFNIYLPI